MYARGVGHLHRDVIKAAYYNRLAADGGNPVGQHNLACAYEEGVGIVQNYEKAAYYFELSAQQGLAQAQAKVVACLRQAETGRALWQLSRLCLQEKYGLEQSQAMGYLEKAALHKKYTPAQQCLRLTQAFTYLRNEWLYNNDPTSSSSLMMNTNESNREDI